MDATEIKIPPNKKRFPLLFVAGAIVTFLVALLLRNGINDAYGKIPGRILDSIILFIPLFYASVGLVDYLRVMFDANVGLFITPTGIYDNLGTFSCGEIDWPEISGVEVIQVMNINVLLIKLVNPDAVIGRQSFLKRRQLKQSARKTGSPIVISERKIDYDIFKLKAIITIRIA